MSFNITGRFIKIWKSEIKEKMVLCDVSTSEKQQDGTYENSNYYGVKFVGKCLDNAKSLKKGDSIEIISGKIGKRKWQEKFYDDVVVFAFRIEESQGVPKNNDGFDFGSFGGSGFVPVEDPALSEDLPF